MRVMFEFCEPCELNVLSGNPPWGNERHPVISTVQGVCSCCGNTAAPNSTIPMEAIPASDSISSDWKLR